jgi:outer membrane receptor for ferric coprogen and ferric-rhodotorulic acid
MTLHHPTGTPLRLLAATTLVSLASLHAQTVSSPTPNSNVVVLSPFQVNTTSDVGYEASRSLAGIGLNTKLTDLGASVSVVNARFLEDTG